MSLFDRPFTSIVEFIETESAKEDVKITHCNPDKSWPKGGGRNFVLKQDTAVELGHPKIESISFVIWSNHMNSLQDNSIFIKGPSLAECKRRRNPFGQVLLLGVEDSAGESDWSLFRKFEEVKSQLDLQGYMRRGDAQFTKEWSRVSKESLQRGFSFETLGASLVGLYKKLDLVKSAQILFITDPDALAWLKPVANQVMRIIQAMKKLSNQELPDCDNCDFQDVCDDIEELQVLRNRNLEFRSN